MRHNVKNRKFGRETNVRKAFIRSLTQALIQCGKIKTTEARAKEIRPIVEKLVSKGREGTLSSRRLIISRLGDNNDVKKLCDEISPKYKDRKGGYTRIVKLPQRTGDASKMAIIEFV